MSGGFQAAQKTWDKVFMATLMVLWNGWLVLMAFDAVRFHWSQVPVWVQIAGAVLIALCMYVFYLTFRENSYAAPVVKIQTERGHRVVTTGPYAYVRHPMYAGALLLFVGAPLLLGSWYGLAAALVLIALLIARIVMEERTLTDELPGYPNVQRACAGVSFQASGSNGAMHSVCSPLTKPRPAEFGPYLEAGKPAAGWGGLGWGWSNWAVLCPYSTPSPTLPARGGSTEFGEGSAPSAWRGSTPEFVARADPDSPEHALA